MDVVLRSRSPKHGPGRFHPKAVSGHGCITVLLLGPLEIGVITAGATPFPELVYQGFLRVRPYLQRLMRGSESH